MKSERSVTKRIHILIAVMAIWGTVIGGRLFFLHVVYSADYKRRAERQQQRTLDVSPRRGIIYDRNGSELAVSIKVDSVFAVPDEVEYADARKIWIERTAKTLAPILRIFKESHRQKLDIQRS